MMTREQTKAFLNAFIKLRDGITDQQASLSVDIYPSLKEDGSLVKVGTRIKWNNTIMKAAVDLYDTKENNPTNTPALWEAINYKEGYRIIPEVITTTSAFALNECGWWNNQLYKSLIDSNVWTPDQHAGGWELLQK